MPAEEQVSPAAVSESLKVQQVCPRHFTKETVFYKEECVWEGAPRRSRGCGPVDRPLSWGLSRLYPKTDKKKDPGSGDAVGPQGLFAFVAEQPALVTEGLVASGREGAGLAVQGVTWKEGSGCNLW